jgi:ATP-binding cassette subfamily F protein 3
MITVSQLSKHFPTRTVLDKVDWHVSSGERIGLVGANGAGKSTLIKILIGQLDPDEGKVSLRPRAQIGHLAQELPGVAGRTVQAEMWTAFEAIASKSRELAAIADRIHHAGEHGTPQELDALVAEQAYLTDEFERLGGYTAETEIGKVLAGLGFSEADRQRPVESFSGGWQMRVNLAKLLLMAPDLLLLDEPTNHLDLQAIEWLEDYLSGYPGTLLLISHDRTFLDRVITRVAELENGKLTDYATNYSGYLELKKERMAAQEAAYARQQRELARQQAFVEKFRASATRSTQAKSREKQLEKIERIEAPTEASTVKFRFPPAPPSGQAVLRAAEIRKAYGGKTILDAVDLKLDRGQRLVLVGPNGCGKSTLLRILAQVEEPDDGEVALGYNVKPAYYSQHQSDQLDESRTVLDEAYYSVDGWTLERTRALLARFLFTGEEVFKPVAKLSGGERARLCLAKLLMRPSNLLMLDEPTNHLDLASKEMLAEALRTYEGTVLLISHDRYLLDQVATHTLAWVDGRPQLHLGTYSETRAKLAELRQREREDAQDAQRQAAQQQAGPAAAPAAKPKKNTNAARQRLQDIAQAEADVASLEAQIAQTEADLGNPALYEGDPGRAAELSERYTHLKAQLEAVTERWLMLVEDDA